MTEATPEVTRHDVEQLWADVIAGRISWQDTSARAEGMVERVNSENPIVNEGLLALYYLWRPGAARDPVSLSETRERWRDKLAEYDADPAAWTKSYFRRMLVSHAEVRGGPATRTFGAKLVAQGLLAAEDVDQALGRETPRPSDPVGGTIERIAACAGIEKASSRAWQRPVTSERVAKSP